MQNQVKLYLFCQFHIISDEVVGIFCSDGKTPGYL